jgi:DNA-directed RNA polymerase specialized sigma24 family protein
MSSGKGRTPAEMLVDPGIAKVIDRVLVANGVEWQDVEDGRQEVYVKALTSFQRTEPPDTLEQMEALCVVIATNYAIDVARAAATRERNLVEGCDPNELAPLGPPVPRRDPVDTGRELEVLAQLFREGRMPEHGVDVLEGVACRCTHQEIALDLRIEPSVVKRRLHRMRTVYRRRMEKLGLLPNVTPLLVLVSTPSAVDVLRSVA